MMPPSASTLHNVKATQPPGELLRPCPLCDSTASTAVFQTIRKCCNCGLRFVNPLGSFRGEHESKDYFLKEYLPLQLSNLDNSIGERRAHVATIQKYRPVPGRVRLLDVGCALGLMLKEASDAGWHATGVETSEFAARYAMERTGCPVHIGTLQSAAFEAESFDVITLMDVIEHVPAPRPLMNEVHRVLRPGGVVFLVTPNFGSLFVSLYGEKAYGIGPDEHVTYFQPSTIRRLLIQSGFRDIMTCTKDFYAENLRRLLHRNGTASQSEIKRAFGSRSSLGWLRQLANKLLMHIPVGDKLIALATR